MLTTLLTLLASITKFLPLLEKWGDALFIAFKDAQARAAKQHDDDANARAVANSGAIEKAIAAANAVTKPPFPPQTPPAP